MEPSGNLFPIGNLPLSVKAAKAMALNFNLKAPCGELEAGAT